MLAEIDRKIKIQEVPKWALRETNMGPFRSLATWGSGYIEQWNAVPFISKIRFWVSLDSFSGYLHSMCAFIFRRPLGEKSYLDR